MIIDKPRPMRFEGAQRFISRIKFASGKRTSLLEERLTSLKEQ